MKTLLFILFTFLPFTIYAQFAVKAYKTTDKYNRKVVRIEIKNTSDYNLKIRNPTSADITVGTSLYFNTNKEGGFIVTYGFLPNRFETDEYKLRYVDIEKGKTVKADIPLSEIEKSTPVNNKFYLLGYIEYNLFTGNNNNIQPKEIKWIEVEVGQ